MGQVETEEETVWTPVMGEARAVKQSYARRWRLPVFTVLGMAAAVFLVVALSRQGQSTISADDDPYAEDDPDTETLLSLAEEKKKKDRLPKPYECSKSEIQNCHISQCCLDFGHQCYSKNETYAACLKTCNKDTLMKNGNGSWSCNYWAQCMYTCD